MPIVQRIFANNAKTTLATAVGVSDTTIQVADGSKFPQPTTGQFFSVTIDAGSNLEVIYCQGRTGNTLTGCLRGQEGTTPGVFQQGMKIENRDTAGGLNERLTVRDKLVDLNSVDDLDTPANSTSNSYVCASGDDAGNPIVAIKHGATWRFLTHSQVLYTSSVTTGTTTSIALSGANAILSGLAPGKYLIQFTTGANQGIVRTVTNVSSSAISWATALPNNLTAGDAFEVYKSDTSNFNDLQAGQDDGLIFSILFSN